MISLLELTAKENQIAKKLRNLAGNSMVCSPEIITLQKELEDTKQAIAIWGKQSNVTYRIM